MNPYPAAIVVGALFLSISSFAQAVQLPIGTCGDPNSDEAVTASDALYVLDAAVGLRTCSPYACDVDDSGHVTAKDALIVLQFAVAIPVSLDCPTTPTTIVPPTSSTIFEDECFDDSDCDPAYGQAGPYCCDYNCCECDADDSQCGEGEHCEGEICVPNP